MKMKSKLSEELEIVTEKYEILNMKYNKLALAENGYKKQINEMKLTQQKPPDISQKYKNLEQENSELKKRITVLEKNDTTSGNNINDEDKLTSMAASIQELQMENKALKIALHSTSELKTSNKNEKTIEVYEVEIAHLRSELENLKRETAQKATIALQKPISESDNPVEEVLNQDEYDTDSSNSNNITTTLKEEKEKYENEITKIHEELVTLKKEKEMETFQYAEQLRDKEAEISRASIELNEMKKERAELEKDYFDLQEINRELKKSKNESEMALQQEYENQVFTSTELKQEIELLKNRNLESGRKLSDYFSYIIENFKEYLDENEFVSEDAELVIQKVSSRIKQEFAKMKTNLQEVNQSKKDLQKEKDEEIGKLLDHSEMLNLELSRKSEELKDAEEECSHLMKNNELLISKLEELKDTGLQTIFESNEDNVATLENQLDSANKSIEELEILLAESNNGSLQKNDPKIERDKNVLAEELRKFEKEKEFLLTKIKGLEDTILSTESERDNCRVLIDKMRLDFETTEFQFSEMNVNLQTLSEEIEKHKMRIDSLVSENQNLKSLRLEDSRNDEELKLMKEDLRVSKGANESLQEKIKEIEQRYEFESRVLEEENEKLKNHLEAISFDKSVLEKRVEETATTIESLKKELEILECENDKLRISEGANECLQEKIKVMEERYEFENRVLEKENEKLKNHLEKISLDKSVLEKHVEETATASESLRKELVIRESENDKLRISGGAEESSQENIKEIEERYEFESRELQKEKEKLEKHLEAISFDKSVLEKCVEESATAIECLKKELEIRKGENDMLNNIYGSLQEESSLNQDKFDISNVSEFIKCIRERIDTLQLENMKLTSELETYKNKEQEDSQNENAQKELQNLMASRNELIAIVQTKHQETLTYHAEIQRLSEILKQETDKNILMEAEIDALKSNSCPIESLKEKEEQIDNLKDQIEFLKQKCDVLAQGMLEEQQRVENEKSTSSEKEAALSKKLERLQSHLMEVEEHYTQELLQSEQKIALLQARLNEVEKREKDSSNIYTSVSIRANQQNEALTQQLQAMTSQRDEFKKKLLDLEDENNVKSAALMNLQLVLEQFQRDKDADVIRETDRIRRQFKQEQKVQENLRKEIANLEIQIKESKQGLQAALRLTDQLEMSKSQISILRQEVSVLTEKLHNKEEELKDVTSQTDGKVDKSLIKNLIIGFVTSNKNLNKDQKQILKIIATVLDFNEQDHNKVNLNQEQHNTWLKSLLSPSDDLPPNESLSRAFVNFLENESKPRVIPSLLPQGTPSETSSSSVNSSTRATPTPIVLNEIVLPTFSDFPQHRNSSSILKGVLKDNP